MVPVVAAVEPGATTRTSDPVADRGSRGRDGSMTTCVRACDYIVDPHAQATLRPPVEPADRPRFPCVEQVKQPIAHRVDPCAQLVRRTQARRTYSALTRSGRNGFWRRRTAGKDYLEIRNSGTESDSVH